MAARVHTQHTHGYARAFGVARTCSNPLFALLECKFEVIGVVRIPQLECDTRTDAREKSLVQSPVSRTTVSQIRPPFAGPILSQELFMN